jgi:hypothetical protein
MAAVDGPVRRSPARIDLRRLRFLREVEERG